MCDTWVALPDATASGQMIFAKNSDRPIFDCQPLVKHARQKWPSNSRIALEYIEIEQVAETFATLGSSPYWCWGYEEGINEHSVVIGNEAIYTKSFRENASRYRQNTSPSLGLVGMDLVRLALERSQSAAQAVTVMGELLERHGQFGSGVPGDDHATGGYDNAYLVADSKEAWVVETAGNRWIAQRITQGVRSISNHPSIRSTWDRASEDLVDHAVQQGWWPAAQIDTFDFARAYVDEQHPRVSGHLRSARTQHLMARQLGSINMPWMKRIARDHQEESALGAPSFDAADPDIPTVCMHVSPANITWGNTASSCLAILPRFNTQSANHLPIFWWTPGPPCNGCYVPFFVHGETLPSMVSATGTLGKRVVEPDQAEQDHFAPDSYWWRFRELLDRTKGAAVGSRAGYYAARNPVVRKRFDPLESTFEAELVEVMAQASTGQAQSVAALLDAFTAHCVQRVATTVDALLEEFGPNPQ